MFHPRIAWSGLLLATLAVAPLSAKPTGGDSAAYRKTLDANAKDETAFKNLLRALKPGEMRDDLGLRFSRLADPSKAFNAMAEECRRTRDSVALEQIANAMKEMNPQQPGVDAILLRAKLANGKIADATALFRAAAKATKDPLVQKGLRDAFLEGMANAGKAVDAYRAFPGGKESFHVLADQLSANGNAKALRELIDEHQVFLGDDPYLSLYAGQLFYEAGKFADADTAWTTAFKTIKNVEIEERFQRRWFRARLAVGKAFDGANPTPNLRTLVTHIADEMLFSRQTEALEKLLKGYAKTPKHDYQTVMQYRLRLHADADFATLAKIADEQKRRQDSYPYWDLAAMGRSLEAYKAAPDARAAFSSLGSALVFRRKFSSCPGLIALHRKAEPTDPMTAITEAGMWLELGQAKKVIESLTNLKTPANFIRNYEVKRLLTDAHHMLGEGLTYYQDSGFDSSTFSSLAFHYACNHDAVGLEALLAARPANDSFPFTMWEYQAKAKIFAGKPNEAMAIYVQQRDEIMKANPLRPKNPFQPFQPKKKLGGFGGAFGAAKSADRQQREFGNSEAELLRAMAGIGQGVEMYRLAAFPEKAFATLTPHVKNVDALEKLSDEHRRKFPNDPDLPLSAARVALWRGELAKAIEICRSELAKPEPEPLDKSELGRLLHRSKRPQLHGCLLDALVRQGKTLDQYRLYGSDMAAFERLGGICVYQKEVEELEFLITAHRKSEPKDPNIRRYEAEAKLLRGDYGSAAKMFLALEIPYGDHREKGLRCLVRAKRFAEALQLAKDWGVNAPLSNSIPIILAYAAAGDAKEVARQLDFRCRRYDYPERFYADEDLGPLLRSDAFKSVRERFPDPAKKRQ